MVTWRRFGRSVLAVTIFALLAGCGIFGQNGDQSPTPTSQTEVSGSPAEGLDGAAFIDTVRQLEKLTLDADGTRGPGSQGYLAAASWIEKELEATGFYEVYRQEFTIQRAHPGESRLTDESGRVINQQPLGYSPGTPDEGLSGILVAPANGNGCQAADWGAEVRGQIGIIDRGGCPFTQSDLAASQAGAIMLIAVNNREGGLYGTLDNSLPDHIPFTGVTKSEGAGLRDQMAAGDLRLNFTFQQRIESYPTYNLFAETRTGDPENVVMAGAHLDSVPQGPGSNDNGSGSAILLETARQMASGEPPANKVRYAWWSGEEWGLLGSAYWVNKQIATSPQTLTRLAAYLNIDMVASPNYVIGVYDGDGSSFPDEKLPAASGAIENTFNQYFDGTGQAWVDIEMGGASDHASFIASGIPVGGLFTGAGETKTAEEEQLFGGTAGQPYDSNYHKPSDTFANLSTDALVINGKAAAHVICLLADDTSTINGSAKGNSGTPTSPEPFGYAVTV